MPHVRILKLYIQLLVQMLPEMVKNDITEMYKRVSQADSKVLEPHIYNHNTENILYFGLLKVIVNTQIIELRF